MVVLRLGPGPEPKGKELRILAQDMVRNFLPEIEAHLQEQSDSSLKMWPFNRNPAMSGAGTNKTHTLSHSVD